MTVRTSLVTAAGLAFLGTAAVADDFNVTCDDIATAIGTPLDNMHPDPSNTPAWVENPDERQLLCSWVTDSALKAMNGQALSAAELQDAGQIMAQVMIYKNPAEVEQLRSHADVHDLPFADAGADLWIFDISPEIDFTEAAGLIPPQLILHDLGVTISTMPLLMTPPTSFSDLTKGWSVEAGARVITLFERMD